ncbi:MAG: class I SAM-dependent methyltransferase [Verrucomicrobiota bacterium]|nr:class I SAM-dependent methyltransferase [Verrucomicrobiota bacterium]
MKALLAHLHAPIYNSRLRVLTELILPHLRGGDQVLDVGCGGGALAARLQSEAAKLSVAVDVSGLERFPRGGEPIQVHGYEGGRFPFPDQSFDAVVVADVLHHEEQPDVLLRECVRVSRRTLIIKDHQLCGPLAKARVSLIDWAANAPYGVKCLYRYHRPQEWDAILRDLQLDADPVYRSIDLYPAGVNFLFGGQLQYLAVCQIPKTQTVAA